MNTERKYEMTIETPQCYHCGEFGEVGLTAEEVVGYEHWLSGNDIYIQDCLPTMPQHFREQIITGTHPKCWEDMFNYGDEEEDEYKLGNFAATETQIQPPSAEQEYPQMVFFFGEEETPMADIMQKVMQETLSEVAKWKEGK